MVTKLNFCKTAKGWTLGVVSPLHALRPQHYFQKCWVKKPFFPTIAKNRIEN